jgi:hypothetical protein
MNKKLRIDLDELYREEYFCHTEYDIGKQAFDIIIRMEDKEKFLDAFAKIWREKAEKLLEEYNEKDYNPEQSDIGGEG